MTSNTDAVSRLPLGSSENLVQPLRWLSIGIVFLVAILLRQVVPLNTDVSWLLTVGERVLDGQRGFTRARLSENQSGCAAIQSAAK